MNSRHLRIFVAVCKAGSFSHAAVQLGMSQPALSRIIRELEAKYSLQFFSRTGRGVRATEAGQRFHNHALRILDELKLLESELSQFREYDSGEVNVSIPIRVGKIMMVPLIKQFSARFPKASIHVFENLNLTTQKLLLSGEMDIGIFYLPPKPPGLAFTRIGIDELYVVGRPALVGPNDATITMAEAAKLPMILQSSKANYREFINRAFAEEDYFPNVVRELETVDGTLAFAAEGEGATILPYCNVWEEVESGLVSARRLVERPIDRQVCMALRNQSSGKLVREAMMLVRNVIGEYQTKTRWLRETGDEDLFHAPEPILDKG